MGVETEIKLATTPKMLARLLADPRLAASDGSEIHEELVSTYFDTIDSRLHAAGAALRIREKSRAGITPVRREQTLKLIAPHQAAVHRQEWNIALPPLTPDTARHPAHPAAPDPTLWPQVPRAALAALARDGELLALGATHVTRIRRRIRHGTGLIEIMADVGAFSANAPAKSDLHQPICELELELVEGELADTLSLAATLPLGPELVWLVAGKGQRCRALAHDEPLRATPAAPIHLTHAMTVADGFCAIGWSCLNHLLANYPLVLRQTVSPAGNAEAVHQARVAIRRLRAAFSLFGAWVNDAQTLILRDGLKIAASALAPARDTHVLLERLTTTLAKSRESSALLGHLATARDAATMAAQAHLQSAAFQRLLVDLALWFERGIWRAAATAPLAKEAPAILHRRQRKLRRRARTTDLEDDAALHNLRIDVKKLRYAIDFMETAFPKSHTRSHARRQERLLGKLQDDLGDLHDIALAASPAHGLHPAFCAHLCPDEAQALGEALAAHSETLATHTASLRPGLRRRAERLLAKNAQGPHWWDQ